MNWDQSPPDLLAPVLGPSEPIGPNRLPRPYFMRVDDAIENGIGRAASGAARIVRNYTTSPDLPSRPAPPRAPGRGSQRR